MQRHPRIEEVNALLSSISTMSTSSDLITRELLDFILALLDPPSASTDTTVGLLCEPLMSENLYALLTITNLSGQTKEIVMKIIKYLVSSRRVPQQIRAQLRLETNHIGFGGIISGLAPDQLNVSIVRDILNLIINSDSTIAVDHLNVVLTMCSAASLDVRYVAMRKLMTCFIAHPLVCRSYAKSHGWQETLTHFFIKSRRSPSVQSNFLSVSTNVLSNSAKDQSLDSGRGSTNGITMDQSQPASNLLPPRVFETSSSPDDPTQERLVRQLDLSPITDESMPAGLGRTFSSPRASLTSTSILTSNSLLTESGSSSRDVTTEFFRRHSEEFHRETTTPPPSTSTSREDLLSLAKTDMSNDDLASITSSNDPLSPVIRTSIKHSEQYSRLVPQFRQILGRISRSAWHFSPMISLLHRHHWLSRRHRLMKGTHRKIVSLSRCRCHQYGRRVLLHSVLFQYRR